MKARWMAVATMTTLLTTVASAETVVVTGTQAGVMNAALREAIRAIWDY